MRLVPCIAAVAAALSAAGAFENDGFVQTSGDQFVLSSHPGTVFKVKGFNYYPQDHPWAIWTEWDPAAIDIELAHAEAMGANVIRTFIDYYAVGGPDISQQTLDHIVDFVEMCKGHGMKVMIGLFDGYSGYPAAGTSGEIYNGIHLNKVVGALAGNTGIFAWDVKNEPDWINDTYWSWSLPGAETYAAQRIDWIQRVRNHIKSMAPEHLVTVGLIFNYDNYLPSGQTTVESFVDFCCFHYYPRNYPGGSLSGAIATLESRTSKPINVQEIGWYADWSTGRTEPDQADKFSGWLSEIASRDCSGLVQWTLCDFWGGYPSGSEACYGFLRDDGYYTWKPAAYVYRDEMSVAQFFFVDETPPGPVSDLSAEDGIDAITVSWTNPTDEDLVGTLVRYSTTGYPTGPEDGLLWCDRPAPLPGGPDSYTGAADPAAAYYFAAYAYDDADNYSPAAYCTGRALALLSSPPGLLGTGWNLTSLPIAPEDPDPAAVYLDLTAAGNILAGNLYAYDGLYRAYPAALTEMQPGAGYWLRLDYAADAALVGYRATGESAVPLRDGWSLVGHPAADPVPLASCSIDDGATRFGWNDAVGAGLVDPYCYYYNGSSYETVCASGGCDDDTLRPWYGYWVLANEAGLTLIVPVP